MNHTGIITGSTRTTLGALGEIVACAVLSAGVAFLTLLGIAACGGLQLIVEVSR